MCQELKKEDVFEFLSDKNEDITKRDLYSIFHIKKDDKAAKNIVGDAYDEFYSAKLNYNFKKGKTHIEKLSPVLQKIKDNTGLKLENNIVLLTKENANIIDEIIQNDDDYLKFAETLFSYIYKEKGKKIKTSYNDMLLIIREIDRDNSTNVWRYKTNKDSIRNAVKYITIPDNEFFNRLEQGDINLPDDLCDNSGPGMKSLSSKICKYISEWIGKDNYYINDKYVRHALLFYLDYYGIDKVVNGKELNSSRDVDKLAYVELYKLLELLNSKCKDLSKSELDHILWYCYKSFNA